MIQEIKQKIGEIGVFNFPLDFLEWFHQTYIKPNKVEQAEQSVLLIYRMNRRKNKGTKGKNEEYD